MDSERVSVSGWLCLAGAIIVVVLTKLLPPPSGLPEAGFQILGILMAAILLFLSWGTEWTSMAIVFAMMTVPGITVADVTKATFGNNTVIFLLFCFMLAACLTKSGIARRIAVWFLTNDLARKSPWWTIAMYFAAVYVLDFFLSAATCIMILMPILLSIFEGVGLENDRKGVLATSLLMSTVVVAQLANGANPISHAVTMQGFSLFESYTGTAMDFFKFCIVCAPISLAGVAVMYLLLRFVWRPDVSPFRNIDFDSLAASCGPVSKKEKASITIYLIVVVLWLLPGLSGYIIPSASPVLQRLNNCLPPLAALFIMHFIHVDGERILDWNDALKSVNWGTVLFIASIMGLGSFMGKAEYGISQWLSDSMAPIFSNVSPIVFLLLMVTFVNVLTNFCSNAVALSVVFALAIPLTMGIYADTLNVALTAMLITSGAQNGWATVPATPTAAVAYTAGYGNMGSILKWGLLMMLLQVLICIVLGLFLAGIFL